MIERWPVALSATAARLLDALRAGGHRPHRIEILLGPDVLESLDREQLVRLTAVSIYQRVPVTFPEQPGNAPFCVTVRAFCPCVRLTANVAVELLVAGA